MRARILQLFLLPFLLVTLTCAQEDQPATKTKRGWLGVSTRDMTPRLAREEGLKVEKGAFVNDVLDDSPAEKAGLKEGDVILEFNGKKVDDADDLVNAVRETDPGSSVPLVAFRDGGNKSLQVTVGTARHTSFGHWFPPMPDVHPHVRIYRNFHQSYGLHLTDLNEQLGEYFGAPDGKGVLVEEVEEGSAAEKAGFKAGDVIVKVDKTSAEEAGDIFDALEDAHVGDKAEFQVLRKGTSMTLALTVEKQHHGFKFRSEGHPEMFDKMHFDFDKLKIELKSLGKTIQENMEHLREKLHEEFTSTWS